MLYANLLLNVLYHIEIEMKIRESCLQTGNFIYKPGISLTKQDFHLQRGSLGLQRGFSGYYLPHFFYGEKYMINYPEDGDARLMKAYNTGKNDNAFDTMTSMRNVDISVGSSVLIWKD